MSLTNEEIKKFTDLMTDSSFRLLGFSLTDLREIRRILDTTGHDLHTLALALGITSKGKFRAVKKIGRAHV